MKLIKFLLFTLISLAVILGIVGFFLPDSARVERSISINAPSGEVYALLNDMSRFNEWSPWANLDPNAQYTFSGPAKGVGAKMAWASQDRSVGNGSMEITASRPDQRVETYLDFGDQGDAQAAFDIVSQGGATRVTWTFETSFDGNIIQRYFGLVMDSLVGSSYEKGLAKLKTVVES